MLYVIGVRPIGQEMLPGPWCNSNHRDWSKPCRSKPKLAPVWECLVNNINNNEPTNYRKEISHPIAEKQVNRLNLKKTTSFLKRIRSPLD